MAQQAESGSLMADVEPYSVGDDGQSPNSQPHTVRREHTVPRKLAPMVSGVEVHPVSSTGNLYKPISESESDSTRDGLQKYGSAGDVWSPGFWRRFPFRGILALCGCLACIVASIVVLVVSDDQPTDTWTLSPTVYLAFLMAGTNMLARFAFHEGVKIAWWRKILRGSTVKDLHDQWAHADGFLEALFAGRQFNLVALASIAVTVMVIDQPLIQRASSVISVPRTSLVNVTAQIAPEIPWGYTGFQASRGSTQQVMTQPMISVFNDYNSQAPINAGFSGCKDTCIGYVAAGGLSAKCTTIGAPIQYNLTDPDNESVSPFSVKSSLDTADTISSQITLDIAYTDNSNATDCTGVRTERICSLFPATLLYPVTVINGSTLRLGDVANNATTLSFQPPPPNSGTDGGSDYVGWTIGGLYLAANNLFASQALYTFGGGIGYYLTLPDTLSNQFLEPIPLTPSGGSAGISSPAACRSNWADPTSHILNSLNEMAFRLSLVAKDFPYRTTNTTPAPQFLTMQQTSNVNVFHSEYRFLISSTVLTTVFVILIIPTFVGWWELGRTVTLNPIETAKAFDAPSLQGPGSNAPLSTLVRSMGGRGLKLGEVDGYTPGSVVKRHLKLANPIEVTRPRAGVAYA
ncbi:hypothetical protein B7463_g11149, partial [Scytalidium lignicola]